MDRTRQSFRRIALALACLLAACGKDSTGPSINPVGSWSGSTSQGRPISFQVTSGGITTAAISWHLSGTVCSYDADASISGGSPLPVTNNAFSASSLPIGSDTFLSVTGRFTSSTAASGTFQITDTFCGGTLNGTWSATKS